MERIFKRKLYDRLLEWKRIKNGKSAIMIEGARRVGKSTLVDMMNKDYLLLQLQAIYNIVLKRRKSVIIFDDVQSYPFAHQAIKPLAKDGRYDYIKTGSLINIVFKMNKPLLNNKLYN
nr:AAA family ATPase [Bacteroides heparinolyticus]